MKRKEFLKKAGVGLVSGPFILSGLTALTTQSLYASNPPLFNCVLAPQSTGGPFYLDPNFNRKNITEGTAGLPVKIKIKVLGVNNCEPVPNALVNIWHCNTQGCYSEFGQVAGNVCDASNGTWLRGYQTTDANGECEFETNFPGWYPGRATHIHYDVHIGFDPTATVNGSPNASSTFMSQMYVPDALKTKVYTELAPYTDRGDNPTNNGNDGIFNGEVELMMTFDESNYPNELSADFCIGLDMDGLPSSTKDREGRSYFQLYPNYPNPYSAKTSIAFSLQSTGTITLSVFNTKGELVEQLVNRRLIAGDYEVEFDRQRTKEHLPAGSYLFEMMFHNAEGRFRQSRQMTLI